ncbi:flagellar basal body-associated FliL family protein [Roseomonas xinghualingensis]|uniref:flagellar basal body-associated FliL family protein n=1 Tax=Roseomonas xinghualingensis TaxID=2986475 RepID=UPI0021F15569|nr:flagellar basal body-associated FliL family protein [Roseomonas sp. SXEYE001]MCV4208029.1 flagellar basal body-associated FliL family protein [Roseomonas sp. SXEYE001]
MAQAATPTADGEKTLQEGGRKRLLLALPLLLGGLGGGLWYAGMLPFGHSTEPATEAGAAGLGQGAARAPVFMDMPEILTNLNASGRRATFIRLRTKLELASEADAAVIQAAMPRLLDLFQTYLREMRPEELRGSQGTYRLREELRNRAAIAAHPAKVLDVLFIEMIVQ